MKVNSIFTLLLVVGISSCRNDQGPLPVTSTPGVTPVGECDSTVYYVEDIVPLTSKYCTDGCHQPGDANGDFTSYIGTKAKLDAGTIQSTLFDASPYPMPPAGSDVPTDAEKKKINCWIKQGYPNNAKDPSKSSSASCTTPISYSNTVAPIIAANCSSAACHGSGTVNSVDFSTYSGIQPDATNGVLYDRVVTKNSLHNPPVIVNPPLTADQISKINCWIQQGGLNN